VRLHTDVAGIKSDVKQVQKDVKLVLKYHDENVIHLRSRIERLEDHTGLVKPDKN
jgi:hypothetical protein